MLSQSGTKDPGGLADWLEAKAKETRLQACELALHHFRATADADPAYAAAVGRTVWEFLLGSTPQGERPEHLLAQIRNRLDELAPDRLDALCRKLEGATQQASEAQCTSGRLVACWFRTIALQQSVPPRRQRAMHIARGYEAAFAAMARLIGPSSPDEAAAGSGQDETRQD